MRVDGLCGGGLKATSERLRTFAPVGLVPVVRGGGCFVLWVGGFWLEPGRANSDNGASRRGGRDEALEISRCSGAGRVVPAGVRSAGVIGLPIFSWVAGARWLEWGVSSACARSGRDLFPTTEVLS